MSKRRGEINDAEGNYQFIVNLKSSCSLSLSVFEHRDREGIVNYKRARCLKLST